jgi:excisionase family DNA binding protein
VKGYLTILEAARFLGVTAQTLRNWDKQGKLSPYRHPLNNYRLYKEGDLKRLVQKIKRK